jgi:hypothetical protein
MNFVILAMSSAEKGVCQYLAVKMAVNTEAVYALWLRE